MSLRDRVARWRRDLEHKRREFRDRWRDTPLRTRIAVVSGLCAAILLGAGVVAWTALRWNANRGVAPEARVVLYTSCDAPLLAPIIGAFEEETGIRVSVVSDTEATKTTGLVARILAERAAPRADVWWSNEALGTARLASEGLLDPFAVKGETDFPRGWPEHLRAQDRTWYGFALRARVIAYNSNRVPKSQAPARLRDLATAAWANRVGIARPQFGTTRTHIAALVAMHGEQPVRDWLGLLKAQGLRVYDSNSAVVRAIANGEIDAGLTDTDDCFAALRENWPVRFSFETPDRPGARFNGLPSAGPVVIPNTVGKIRACPHPNQAQKLAEFLLSSRTERLLAQSDSRNLPVRESLAAEFPDQVIPDPAPAEPRAINAAQDAADRVIADLFPLR